MGEVRGGAAIVDLRGITKRYPGVVALEAVNLSVLPNEIVGLVGENGAGKSTLMKVLIGLVQPDEGTIVLQGNRTVIRDPEVAIRRGIGMVFQEGSLIPNLSVLDNLFLCHEVGFQKLGILSRSAMRKAALETLAQVRVKVDLDSAISEVSPAVRQMVEIARLLWLSQLYGQSNPVLILDEPTTVLNDSERETLFEILADLKRRASVVLISHRLQEILAHSDRIVVLKDGRNVTEIEAGAARLDAIEQLMVGHGFSADRYHEEEQSEPRDKELLRVEGLGKQGLFEEITFAVREGEIVSLVGLVGSGKEELCQCITGLEKADRGSISLGGTRLPPGAPSKAVAAGIGHVPIDRRNDGLALGMGVGENINLLVLKRLRVGGLISPRRERANARRWIEECQIKTPSVSTMCGTLSGGNQQKIVISKWLSSQVRLLVLDHPTRGVDVGARDEIFRLIRSLARDGIGMLIMCDTLEEDIGLSNRMLIMKDGRLVTEVRCPPNGKPTPSDVIGAIV